MFDEITTSHGVDNHSYKGAGQDGSYYLGNTLDERDISLKVYLIGRSKEHYDQLKTELYQVFNPKLGEGHLIQTDDFKTRKIKCVVDKIPFLVEINGQTGKVNLELLSNNGFWTDINEQRHEIVLWVPNFSFPLSLPTEGIEIGYRSEILTANANNTGDVASGMRIVFKALATVVNPSLYNVATKEIIKINTTMLKGQVITITTGYGNKKVLSHMAGTETNLFNSLDKESVFLQLMPGDNLFGYDALDGIDYLAVTIYHANRYLGV